MKHEPMTGNIIQTKKMKEIADKIRNRIKFLNKDLKDIEQIVFLNNIHADLIDIIQSKNTCDHSKGFYFDEDGIITCVKCYPIKEIT